ncbi:MAG: hypothetical protein ABUL69_02285 [Peristeroidobacter soli]
MKTRMTMLALALSLSRAAVAQDSLEEVVVTGTRAEGSAIPGTSLKRPGDFILLMVEVSNDSRDAKTRKEEIEATLRAMMAAAGKDKSIELSVIGDNNLVLPLKLDSATLNLVNGKKTDTSETTISVKTRIPQTVGNSSALVAKLRDFATGIKPVGRTLIDGDGDFEISIVKPSQYRDRVIELFAADVKKVTAALGADYKVVVHGIDAPIQWVRDGMLEVTIFVPYSYDVLPASVTSYTRTSE